MPELKTKKSSIEETHPVLSLKQNETKTETTKEETEEQEALWSRSLEFFNTMNMATSHS